eukprot:GHVO01069878.1.p1 GENE.GHVO01069878.1~~GHVO01069878.1.p1  ORF type:complete len:204 (+),score=33.18 GHVO01069878.1:111-722(+)
MLAMCFAMAIGSTLSYLISAKIWMSEGAKTKSAIASIVSTLVAIVTSIMSFILMSKTSSQYRPLYVSSAICTVTFFDAEITGCGTDSVACETEATRWCTDHYNYLGSAWSFMLAFGVINAIFVVFIIMISLFAFSRARQQEEMESLPPPNPTGYPPQQYPPQQYPPQQYPPQQYPPQYPAGAPQMYGQQQNMNEVPIRLVLNG